MDYELFTEGTIDAYLKIIYNGQTLKTKVAKQDPETRRAFWEQAVWIPVEIPLRDDRVKIQLWDYDALVDEFVCSLTIPVKSMLKYVRTNPREGPSRLNWINLYGPPQDTSGEHADEMKRDETKASKWAGRVLVEYFCMDSKYPVYKVRPMNKTPQDK